MRVRLAASHREPLADLLARTPEFTPDERDVALELIDEGLAGSSDYRFFVDEEAGRVRGYICYGRTPMTEGTFDLYWIAVDPDVKRGGLGRALVIAMEEEITANMAISCASRRRASTRTRRRARSTTASGTRSSRASATSTRAATTSSCTGGTCDRCSCVADSGDGAAASDSRNAPRPLSDGIGTKLFTRRALALSPILLLTAGCFYDSRWGQTKTAQKHNAALATPAALPTASRASEASSASPTASHVLHVRLYATPAYSATIVDWERHARALLDDANVTLRAAIDAELVIDDARSWTGADAKDRLEATLAALRDEDAGEGADLVLAFIGGLPTTTQDFHQLGMSELPGKHVVLRAPNTADDFDAVEKAFDELSDAERTRLRRERRHHRELAVLLHESATRSARRTTRTGRR